MSSFDDEQSSPQDFYSDNMPTWPNMRPAYDSQTSQRVELSPTGYASILAAIIVLYAICALIMTYLVWDRISRHKAFQKTTGDLEKDGKRYEKQHETYTPGTVVGSEAPHSPQFQTVHLGRAPSSQSFFEEENMRFPLPPPVIRDTGSPGTASSVPMRQASHSASEGSNTSGLSIGDRLRSHLMVREITGGLPPSADALVAATLGLDMLVDRSHSRSSLFTIAETAAESSPLSSPGLLTPSRFRSRSLMANSSRTASPS